MTERQLSVCDECGSEYFADASQMAALCPQCAHQLYGYPACQHRFENGRCTDCHWDGAQSAFPKSLKSGDPV